MNLKLESTCYAVLENDRLVVGNSLIERCWDLSDGYPVTRSLMDKARGFEWVDRQEALPISDLVLVEKSVVPQFQLEQSWEDDLGVGARHLCVVLESSAASTKQRYWKLVIRIYPECSWIRQALLFRKSGAVSVDDTRVHDQDGSAGGVEQDRAQRSLPADYVDALQISSLHCSWKSVSMVDVTDVNNNLVQEQKGITFITKQRVEGNLLLITNNLTGAGLACIKESPTKAGQIHYPGADFLLAGKQLFVLGSGVTDEDLTENEELDAYGSAIGVWDGSELAALSLIKSYYDCLRRPNPEVDYFMMSNTWGDRSRDDRVSEAFIRKELQQAVLLGIPIVQIDDGWQKGLSANSAKSDGSMQGLSGFHAKDASFWEVNPERFPLGFEPLLAQFVEKGVRMALWFAPDSTDDFVHWEKDAEILLHLHRKYGVCYFKLDGIKLRSKRGDRNLYRLMRKVITEADEHLYFCLDVTAGVRYGYLYKTQYGGLFLENRYTDWAKYYPYHTLRNLWLLSRYVPAQKLQIEFLNTARNQQLYEQSPLNPAACGIGYSFGVTMMANPLAWMELTGLEAEDAEMLKALIEPYNRVQSAMKQGLIVPIGNEPNGVSWTGFQSIVSDTEGYVQVIREWSPTNVEALRLYGSERRKLQLTEVVSMPHRNQVQANERGIQVTVSPEQGGTYRFELSERNTFALYHYRFT